MYFLKVTPGLSGGDTTRRYTYDFVMLPNKDWKAFVSMFGEHFRYSDSHCFFSHFCDFWDARWFFHCLLSSLSIYLN